MEQTIILKCTRNGEHVRCDMTYLNGRVVSEMEETNHYFMSGGEGEAYVYKGGVYHVLVREDDAQYPLIKECINDFFEKENMGNAIDFILRDVVPMIK